MLDLLSQNFHWYGFLIAVSILVCQWLAKELTDDENLQQLIDDALLPTIIGGLIGARLYHVLDLLDYYLKNPEQILVLNQGGLGIFGALLGGGIGLYLYLHFTKRQQYLYKLLNAVAITLPLGQAIGRIGNYINKELFGTITTLPWGIKDSQGITKHPLFLYEGLLNLLLFFLLLKMSKKDSRLPLPLYLIGYAIIRIILSPFRESSDTWKLGNIDMAIITSIAMILTGIILLKQNQNKNK